MGNCGHSSIGGLVGLGLMIGAAIAADAETKTVILISGEYEYKSAETLPKFRTFLESNHPLRCVYLERTPGQDIPGLEALEKADLVVLYVRRMTLPEEQLDRIKAYLERGKPLIGLRTASHAFENWRAFDKEVLGGAYGGHFGNSLVATARVIPEAAAHPILRGVEREFGTGGSLYRNSPLPEASKVLLCGSVAGEPEQPVAWTHEYRGARIFYTSLGHPKDFEHASFRQLLVNAIYWALDRPPSGQTASGLSSKATWDRPGLQAGQAKRVDIEEFARLIAMKRHLVLDVRTAKEFAAGHIAGATNLDVTAPDFAARLKALDPDQVYLVHCATGRRSARACDRMVALNFRYLVELAPGFKGWEAAGKPIEK
jgi:rhodanese-related sulfurtransferase/type 1 glutamine amidotransferase